MHGPGTSRDFVSRLAASRPKKLAPLANELVKLDSAVVSMGVDCGWKRRGNRTVPVVEKNNIRKDTREEEEVWKLVREKEGGGG